MAGRRGFGSEELHTEYGVKSLIKPRRGGGRPHYVNMRVMLIEPDGYQATNRVRVRVRVTCRVRGCEVRVRCEKIMTTKTGKKPPTSAYSHGGCTAVLPSSCMGECTSPSASSTSVVGKCASGAASEV